MFPKPVDFKFTVDGYKYVGVLALIALGGMLYTLIIMVGQSILFIHKLTAFTTIVVRLLSLELFILGVQANKLHFCNLELLLNKTGYSHIMENKTKNFSIFQHGNWLKKI